MVGCQTMSCDAATGNVCRPTVVSRNGGTADAVMSSFHAPGRSDFVIVLLVSRFHCMHPQHISASSRPIFTEIFVLVTDGRCSVVLSRHSDTLCTSGFMDDVILANKPRLLDVAAHAASPHAALGLAINGEQEYQLQPRDARDYFSGAESNSPGGSTGGGVCSLCLPCV